MVCQVLRVCSLALFDGHTVYGVNQEMAMAAGETAFLARDFKICKMGGFFCVLLARRPGSSAIMLSSEDVKI